MFVIGTKTYSFLDGDCTDSEAAYLLAISEKVILMITAFHEETLVLATAALNNSGFVEYTLTFTQAINFSCFSKFILFQKFLFAGI